MKQQLKSILVLTAVCIVVAAALGLTNYFTAPVIAQNQEAAANEALLVVYPEGKNFKKVDLSTYTLPSTITAAWSEESGGYVIQLETTGFDAGMVLMCGVDATGKITGATCISSKETLGHEKTYGDKFTGVSADTLDTIDTIAGATKTTEAYKNAMKDAINASIILGGGNVDIRDEAQIFADNLAAALPAGNGAFTSLFIAEVLTDISEIYTADNGEGSVYITTSGDFVGVDKNGAVVGEVDAALAESILAQHAIITASTKTEIDLTTYSGIATNVLKAYITGTGNYVFELRGAGYGINGGNKYHPASGEYIYITLSMTADGTIISCLTTYENETDGIGDACANKDFYSQFSGMTQDDLDGMDAISGATLTTNGYKTALIRAFEALTILKGEATENE